jgi:ABC-2 type transport system permease protein
MMCSSNWCRGNSRVRKSHIPPLVRGFAFVRKELAEILRQPRLILSLIIGPFLVLLLFGLGYRPAPPPLRTVLVVEPGSQLAAHLGEIGEALGSAVELVGTTDNVEEATEQLRQRQIDAVVVAPSDAAELVENNQQAIFVIYHDRLDPFQRVFMTLFAQASVDEINRQVLLTVAKQVQGESQEIDDPLPAARAAATLLREALEQNNQAGARAEQQTVKTALDRLAARLEGSNRLLEGIEASSVQVEGAGQASETLSRARERNAGLNDQATVEEARQLEEDLALLESQLVTFQSIDPAILVSPFRAQTKNLVEVQIPLAAYYGPAVLVLLLQHVGLTFSALSLVRERTLGTTELFRVSPLSVGEALLGKYGAYLAFGGVVAGILTMALIYGFRVPMEGEWLPFVASLFLVLVTSLGLGFLLSTFSNTDSQAVQYSMIVLLLTMFFSGFVLPLNQLQPGVQVVSYLLPATYGIAMLQDIMFRGESIRPLLLAGLGGLAVVLMAVAWARMGKMVRPARRAKGTLSPPDRASAAES